MQFQVQAGLASLVALLMLLGLIAVSGVGPSMFSACIYVDAFGLTKCNYRHNLRKPPSGPWRLFRGNMDILRANI